MRKAGVRTQKRRRREAKTDYSNRLKLLKGHKPRIVFRKTNRYIIAQYVTSEKAQDKVEITMSSKDLLKNGWPKEKEGSLKSLPAAYFTGILIAKKIVSEKKETPILDLGMLRVLHKSKIYAFIKGLIDGGIKIKCPKEAFPEEERIQGKNMKEDFSKKFEEIKSKISK